MPSIFRSPAVSHGAVREHEKCHVSGAGFVFASTLSRPTPWKQHPVRSQERESAKRVLTPATDAIDLITDRIACTTVISTRVAQ